MFLLKFPNLLSSSDCAFARMKAMHQQKSKFCLTVRNFLFPTILFAVSAKCRLQPVHQVQNVGADCRSGEKNTEIIKIIAHFPVVTQSFSCIA